MKETKRAVRDTRAGVEKMAVGHHIGDRSHVIQKQKDTRTGALDEEENLYNIDDSEYDAVCHMQWPVPASVSVHLI